MEQKSPPRLQLVVRCTFRGASHGAKVPFQIRGSIHTSTAHEALPYASTAMAEEQAPLPLSADRLWEGVAGERKRSVRRVALSLVRFLLDSVCPPIKWVAPQEGEVIALLLMPLCHPLTGSLLHLWRDILLLHIWYSACISCVIPSETPAHGTVLPVFRVGLPTSINPV